MKESVLCKSAGDAMLFVYSHKPKKIRQIYAQRCDLRAFLFAPSAVKNGKCEMDNGTESA
jgi:hypothetical protein